MPNSVLTGGEKYSELISKRLGGSSSVPDITLSKAQSRLISDIASTRIALNSLPETLRMPNEFVVCVRMNPKYSAKSYFPKSIFGSISTQEIQPIGSRSWHPNNEKEISAKLIFARTTEQGLSSLEQHLQSSQPFTDQFSLDVRRIEKLDILTSSEKMLGFDADWKEGYVEFVFHPFARDKERVIQRFKEISEITDLEVREYDSGVIFASALATNQSLQKIKDYNPLRSIHPIQVNMGISIRTLSTIEGPKPPQITSKNKIKVGVIDTGINPAHPYFKGVTENEECTDIPNSSDIDWHGTWVTGMLLYGNLNKYKSTDELPESDFYVKSFRVLPQKTSNHDQKERNELYAVIDEIERIVPENPEIKVYNLSLGPSGQIYDDYLTRFTYACDHLMKKHDIQFCVAVGNDGDTSNSRIQSPSDGVNVLSVGAYTFDDNKTTPAEYSCLGPGREGNKFKPDILALGGSEQYPLQFVSLNEGYRDIGIGMTSLATPQVSATIASLIGKYSLDPLSSRSLLLNKVSLDRSFDTKHGHGFLPNDVDTLTLCGKGSFTLQYRGRLLPGKFAQLQIPWPDMPLKGKVTFSWTLVVLADTDELSTDEYTKDSMEISFYPNDSKYVFRSQDKKKTKLVDIAHNERLAKALLSAGWTSGNFPKSASGLQSKLGEKGLRANMKWDSVLQGKKTFNSVNTLSNPFFHLHCIARDNDAIDSQTDYCLTLTVSLDQSDQDIYTPITTRYTALVPITQTIQEKIVVKSDIR